jgi:hypothetical protein
MLRPQHNPGGLPMAIVRPPFSAGDHRKDATLLADTTT